MALVAALAVSAVLVDSALPVPVIRGVEAEPATRIATMAAPSTSTPAAAAAPAAMGRRRFDPQELRVVRRGEQVDRPPPRPGERRPRPALHRGGDLRPPPPAPRLGRQGLQLPQRRGRPHLQRSWGPPVRPRRS